MKDKICNLIFQKETKEFKKTIYIYERTIEVRIRKRRKKQFRKELKIRAKIISYIVN